MKNSKGFTLVELLIVIIIIGILAGMMMLSTGSATDKAEATKIVADMRNIKAACLMYYADNRTWPVKSDWSEVQKYLDQEPGKKYDLVSKTDGLYVRNGKDTDLKNMKGVAKQLELMAEDIGLTNTPEPYDPLTNKYDGTTKVYMVIKK